MTTTCAAPPSSAATIAAAGWRCSSRRSSPACKRRLRRTLPIENQRDRRRIDCVGGSVHQEPLAVRGDGVLLPHHEAAVQLSSKERERCAENDLLIRAERRADGCQPLIGGDIKQFRPVSRPADMLATTRRDLNPITRAGKRLQ